MKRVWAIVVVCAAVLLLGSCNLMYGIFPGADPVVGTWTLSQLTLSSSSGWSTASAAGASGSMTFKDDKSFSGTITIPPNPAFASSGTWSGNNGLYTLNQGGTNGAGVYLMTLSADGKTLFSNNGVGNSTIWTK